jgi:RNA polymerase sigma-70 factor, ECF subfamily
MNPGHLSQDGTRAASQPEPLIARALAGDARAERALYQAYVDRIYRLVIRLTGDEDLALEYTQQAFTRAFLRLSTYRGDSSFATWLHRVAVNVTLSGLRKTRRSQEVEQKLQSVAPRSHTPRPGDPMLRRRIAEALDALPALYREAVVLHDIQGYTHDEIASILDIPAGTSKARLSRARARLRPMLAGCALDYAA